MEIIELQSEAEFRQAFPVVRQLRPHLDEQRYLDLLALMVPEGYRMFAVRDGTTVLAIAGVTIRTNFYNGRHVFVYDLVTDEGVRSQGLGQRLLTHVEEFARREGCATVALNSGMQRTGAHRFYEERMGYERPSYSFTKKLA